MHRRPHITAALIALGISAFAAAPTATALPAAAPAATCTVSAADPAGRVSLSGEGFAQGQALLSSPGAAPTTFNVPDGGAFTIGSKPDDRYAVTQAGSTTPCTGGAKPSTTPGTTYKAGLTAGWDAVADNCDARPPASANKAFSDGWTKGAAVAKETFCK
ncbi:hypothetical protein OHA37_04365 [Streptomyces sp. NBC_00335]|uniref:hypothetical protein n=1 Tax=unclassified Streptomyces TaxID=2593676 RepID=UPI00225649C3|nr:MULTISPECIES: hypothetical protein [unclassified Streptomyces]MCX5403115.1 hypothetical protein [Streptomyces sp. NBC_00086]